ncbi:MAG: HAD-IIB family hydrolase [Pseudomonadota bacterium]
MQPVDSFPKSLLAGIRYVLTDIDDTLTTHGRLPSSSLKVLEELSESGLRVIPVTGRPAGWCDHIARMWPVDAVVGENGALYFAYDRGAHRMIAGYATEDSERREAGKKLDKLRSEILAKVPGAGIASDQDYRIADLAIDFCEDVPRLPDPAIDEIVALFRAAGATAKVSSIHVNGWFGHYDKLSMTRRCLKELFDCDVDAESNAIVFVGDSPNDQPMFAHFQNAVGVANVHDFELQTPPRWVTRERAADGFCEFASLLLEARKVAA